MTGLNKPAHITSLATNSILVSLDVRVWTATKQDKQTSDEVTTAKQADPRAVRVTQHLLAGDPQHAKILNYRQTIYNWMQRRTYPWAGSNEILPVVDLPRFMSEYSAHETNFNQLVDDFISAYPQIVSNTMFKMGTMADRNNYPSPEQAKSKFSIALYTAEVPQGDFRVQTSYDLAEDLQRNFQKQHEQLVTGIASVQAERLVKLMEAISHCCDVTTVVGDDGSTKVKRHKLYDSTIEHALALCESYREFNVNNSQELEAARTGLDKILRGMNLDALRESDSMRIAVKNEVDDILAKFKM